MSTKIYTGFRFKTKDWNAIHRMLMRYRQQLEPLVKDKIVDMYARLSTKALDCRACNIDLIKNDKKSAYTWALDTIESRIKETRKTGLRDPLIDFDCEIALLPLSNGVVLGIIYTEQQEFINLWMRKKNVEEYAYWNNTDPPDHITEKEWQQRSKD